MPCDAGDRRFGQVELEPPLPTGPVRERNMREGVIAELVPVADEQADEIGMAGRFAADDEERRRDVIAAQDRCDPRRPTRIGAVIEGQRDPATRGRLRRDEMRAARHEDRPAVHEWRRTAERLTRLGTRADGVGGDSFEQNRDDGDDEAEAEQAPVRRNP